MPQLHSQRMQAVGCQAASVVGAAAGAVASLVVIGLFPRARRSDESTVTRVSSLVQRTPG